MPTYEYHCDACGHKFERFQSMTAEPIKQCPKCKKNKARRLIGTGAGLIFKGSGFYITDYRSEGYKEKAKADSGGGSSESKSPSSSSEGNGAIADSKPAAKTESAPKADSKSAAKPSKKKN
ncbi:MAG TPA: zinc ribbon domain-containing protein [Tepidisphaeraceae bacterium]|jgi:putative FmdB family regulatory protein